jgi:hypothetical protein
MDPEHERQTRRADRGTKDHLRPRHMADDDIEMTLVKKSGKSLTSTQYGERLSHSRLTQPVNFNSFGGEFAAQSPFEADCEFGFHFRRQVSISGERDQQCLYTTVEIACAKV